MVFQKKTYFFLSALLSITHITFGIGFSKIDSRDSETSPFMKKLYEKGTKKEIQKTKSKSVKAKTKLSSPPCDAPTPITQADIPFVTTGPGKYCVKEDLTFNGPNAAIEVIHDNVCIDFDCHSLTINPVDTQGITAANVLNLSIKNGTIKASSVSSDINSAAIGLVSDDRVLIDHMLLQDTRQGIATGTSGVTDSGVIDLEVFNTEFNHPDPSSRSIIGVENQGVTLENCVFGQVGTRVVALNDNDRRIRVNNCHFLNINNMTGSRGLQVFNTVFPGGLQDVQVTNCDFSHFSRAFNIIGFGSNDTNVLIQNCTVANNGFPDGGFSNSIEVFGSSNVLIENCLLHSDPSSNSGNLAIGSEGILKNVIVRNCTLLNPNAQFPFTNAFIGAVDGLLIENCIFDTNSSIAEPTGEPANLWLLSEALEIAPVTGAKILNCIFVNNPTSHIFIAPGSRNIVIEGCSFEQSIEQSILFQGIKDSVIKDCSIVNSNGSGIVLTDGVFNEEEVFSQKNLIFQNNIQDNAKTGIVLENKSSKNTIEENNVSNNGTGLTSGNDGIFIDGSSEKNIVIGNNVFNNARDGIHNQHCKNNEFYENKACKNGHKNYVNVSPIVTVGSSPRAGANLECCKH